MVGRIVYIIITLICFQFNLVMGQNPTFVPNSPCGYYDQEKGRMQQVSCGQYFPAWRNGVKYTCFCPCNRIPTAGDCTSGGATSGGGISSGPITSNDIGNMFAQAAVSAFINYLFSDNSADKAKAEKDRLEQQQKKQQEEMARQAAFMSWKKENDIATKQKKLEDEQKLKKGEELLGQMQTTGSTSKIEPFSTSGTTVNIQPIGQNSFPTAHLTQFDRLACSVYFSNLAAKATDAEESAFYGQQSQLAMNGQPTYFECRIPKDDKSEIGKKMEKAKVIFDNFSIKLKDYEQMEKKIDDGKQKTETARKEKDEAEKKLDELKKEHIAAEPEKKAEIDKQLIEAQELLGKANDQLKKAESDEKQLEDERKKLEEELNGLKKEMENIK